MAALQGVLFALWMVVGVALVVVPVLYLSSKDPVRLWRLFGWFAPRAHWIIGGLLALVVFLILLAMGKGLR